MIYLCRFPVSPTFLLFVRGVTAYKYEMFQFILVLYIFLESMHQCVLWKNTKALLLKFCANNRRFWRVTYNIFNWLSAKELLSSKLQEFRTTFLKMKIWETSLFHLKFFYLVEKLWHIDSRGKCFNLTSVNLFVINASMQSLLATLWQKQEIFPLMSKTLFILRIQFCIQFFNLIQKAIATYTRTSLLN